MSSAGSAIGRPATFRSAVSATLPSSITHTSQDVPPMSKHSTSRSPAASLSSSAPPTPPAGPDSTVSAACAAARRASVSPPEDCITCTAGNPLSLACPPSRSKYAASRGERAASISVVDARSYSLNVPTSSCDSDRCA